MTMLGTALLAFVLQSQSVEGVVVLKGTTEALSKATVELRRDPPNAGIVNSMTTDEDGRFSFSDVVPGSYRLTVTRRGYFRPSLVISVIAGQPPLNIPLSMTRTASISGHVLDVDGRPMGNVEVQAMKATYSEGTRVLTPVQSVVTNDLGEYRLFWLAPGRYYVAAIHPKAQGMFRQMFSAVAMSMIGPEGALLSVGEADPALGEFGFLGHADSDTDSDRYAPVFFGGTTDEQTASRIDLSEAADFGSVDFVVGPVRARHVRGVVIDGVTGRPAQYGSVELQAAMEGPRTKDVEVDRETAALDMLLFPGPHTLTATSMSGEGYASFTVGNADIENLAVSTTPVFDIPGRLVIDGTPISVAALEDLQISLRRDPPSGERLSLSYSTMLPDGSFAVSATIGDYRINIAPILNLVRPRGGPPTALQNAYVKSIRLGGVDVLGGILHLDGPTSETLEVVIATNPGALDGQVVKRSPGSVADVSVLLLPDVRRRNDLYRTTTTDASGRFHFERVTPGDYKVFSWEEVEDGAWYDPEFMRAYESRGVPVRIREARTETVRIDAIP